MTVSELAALYQINPDTVRHYVRTGLLNPVKNTNNGYKEFGAGDQKRLGFILKAKSLGFSLQDVKTIIEQAEHGESPCPHVREIMMQRLAETAQKIKEMQTTYDTMLSAVERWQTQADCVPTGEHICHLIEGFSEEGCCHE